MCNTQKPEEIVTSEVCSEKGSSSCKGSCDDKNMIVEHNIILMLDPIKKERLLRLKKS